MSAAKPWNPALPVERDSSLTDIANAIGFGQSDPFFSAIGAKLAGLGTCTPADLESKWSRTELLVCIKSLTPVKPALYYVTALETACIVLLSDKKLGSGSGGVKVRAVGGDMTKRSLKVSPSETFNPSKYCPDGRVYGALAHEMAHEYFTKDGEELYLDLLLLATPWRHACRTVATHAQCITRTRVLRTDHQSADGRRHWCAESWDRTACTGCRTMSHTMRLIVGS